MIISTECVGNNGHSENKKKGRTTYDIKTSTSLKESANKGEKENKKKKKNYAVVANKRNDFAFRQIHIIVYLLEHLQRRRQATAWPGRRDIDWGRKKRRPNSLLSDVG